MSRFTILIVLLAVSTVSTVAAGGHGFDFDDSKADAVTAFDDFEVIVAGGKDHE